MSLPSETICDQILFGTNGIAATWQAEQAVDSNDSAQQQSQLQSQKKTVIDHGTFSNSFSVANSVKLKEKHSSFHYIDAPGK